MPRVIFRSARLTVFPLADVFACIVRFRNQRCTRKPEATKQGDIPLTQQSVETELNRKLVFCSQADLSVGYPETVLIGTIFSRFAERAGDSLSVLVGLAPCYRSCPCAHRVRSEASVSHDR